MVHVNPHDLIYGLLKRFRKRSSLQMTTQNALHPKPVGAAAALRVLHALGNGGKNHRTTWPQAGAAFLPTVQIGLSTSGLDSCPGAVQTRSRSTSGPSTLPESTETGTGEKHHGGSWTVHNKIYGSE